MEKLIDIKNIVSQVFRTVFHGINGTIRKAFECLNRVIRFLIRIGKWVLNIPREIYNWIISENTSLIHLLFFEAITFEIMEGFRFYGINLYRGGGYKYGILFLPISLFLVFIIMYKAFELSQNKQTISLFLYAIMTSILVQVIFGEYSIITVAMYVIIGGIYTATFYVNKFAKIKVLIRRIENEKINSEASRQSLAFLSGECKFYLDRWIVMIFTLGTGMVAGGNILWAEPDAYTLMRTQKLTESVYMGICFVSSFAITAWWIALPVFSFYRDCSRVAYDMNNNRNSSD